MPYPTPEAAEAAFYAAFEARSADAMMAVWSDDDDIACIHPLSAPLNGHGIIAAGWRSMFEAAGQFRIQVELAHQLREPERVIRIVREYLVVGHEESPRPPILATNVYRKEADGWRMLLHHASPLQVGGTPPSRTVKVVLH
jgi:ketosteroid isomerase-like protein